MSRAEHNGTVNSYRCPCGAEWTDEWDCGCDDECPVCGTTCSPIESVRRAPCDNPECQRRSAEAAPAVRLVMEVEAFAEGAVCPRWAMTSITPQFVARIEHLQELCRRERLSWVREDTPLERWEGEEEHRIRGEQLVVGPDRFFFLAHPKHADFDIETAGLDIEDFLAAMKDRSARVPQHWCWRGDVLFVAIGDG